jgi:hypothetical protein
MSVNASVPMSAEASTFDSIFSSRRKAGSKSSEVISTLSSVVNGLETGLSTQIGAKQGPERTNEVSAIIPLEQFEDEQSQQDFQSSDSPLPFPSHILSGEYRPFNPPPVPSPAKDGELPELKKPERPRKFRRRTYSAVFTVYESTNASGDKTYLASTSPIVAEEMDDSEIPANTLNHYRTELDRLERQQSQVSDITNAPGEGGSDMFALSVKRQRKLKMKKHKFKKLMRKTRTLRRKLDKI